jgi:uncharacterized damage-inducible protein DinB
MPTDDLPDLFAFHRWADERMLDACRRLTPEQYAGPEPFEVGWPSIRSLLVHQAWAMKAWACRFLGEGNPAPMGEAELPGLEDAAALLMAGHDRFANEVLPPLTPDRLAAIFTYTNYKGQLGSVPLWAALRHVVNHGSYHRGQLASKLKRRGVDPPATDLVFWALAQTPQPS